MRNIALALALGVAATGVATAADYSTANYGAVMGSYTNPDSARDADYGIGGQVVFLGLPLSKRFNVEFSSFATSLERESDGGNDSQVGLGIDLMVPLLDGKIRPFLLAGFGGVYEEIKNAVDDTTLFPYANAGAGVLLAINDRLSARGEIRYMADFNDEIIQGKDAFSDWRFNLGLQYAFGKPAPAPVAVAAAAPAAALPPPDSDQDGVTDNADLCPATPAGVKVNAKGCPLDSDGDGVPDYLDKCPDTPKGFKVDADGCIIEQTIVLRGVNFEFNKDVLTTEAKGILDAVAPSLAAQTKLTLEVGGHTDAAGSDSYNKALSKRRAEAVRQYLIAKGISADRLSAVGYGESKPVADNNTEAGRAENRRVEFQVLNKPVAVKVKKK